MRGVVFKGNCQLELATVPDPTPEPGEVVLQIRASGMCGSDLHLYRSRPDSLLPVVAGHEPCGVVVAAAPGVSQPYAAVGSRVMVHHYYACGGCEHCRSGWPQICETEHITVYGNDAHGAHAPFMKVRAETLVPLDERLSFAAGAAISCGTGTAWGALQRLKLSGRDTIAIFGQGPVGQSATLLASALGARVIAIDIDESRLRTASEFGADATLNANSGDMPEAIRALTGGKGATMSLETAGNVQASRDCLDCVRAWGTVGLVGIGAELNFALGKVLHKQLTILTSRTMSVLGQKACADFVIEKRINLDALFTDYWSLDQAEEAYRKFNQRSGGKGVFVI